MARNMYERFVGYDKQELKYKKVMVKNEVTGLEEEKFVERTSQEVEEYKQQKENEFDNMVATWERLGIKKYATKKVFDEKNFFKLCKKLVQNRLNDLSNENQLQNVESAFANIIDDVDQKYHINVALNYYRKEVAGSFCPSKVFKNVTKSEMDKMFYRNISTNKASELATTRLQKATTIKEGVALIQELQRTHNSRSFFFKLFHPFKNAEENRAIKNMKTEVMQKFSISKTDLENKLSKKVDVTKLKTASLYKINEFINNNCYENSGEVYSQKQIDLDRTNVSLRADEEFIDAQIQLDSMADEMREPIVVEDAKQQDDVELSEQQEREDPNIIKVPKNDKF